MRPRIVFTQPFNTLAASSVALGACAAPLLSLKNGPCLKLRREPVPAIGVASICEATWRSAPRRSTAPWIGSCPGQGPGRRQSTRRCAIRSSPGANGCGRRFAWRPRRRVVGRWMTPFRSPARSNASTHIPSFTTTCRRWTTTIIGGASPPTTKSSAKGSPSWRVTRC